MGSESRGGEITGWGEQGAAGMRGSLCRPRGRPTTPHTLKSGALLGPIACGRAAVGPSALSRVLVGGPQSFQKPLGGVCEGPALTG